MENLTPHLIQWYPGHIAKARRQLQEQLKQADLVLEVLDARIPQASRHKEIRRLIGERQCLVILNKSDLIPASLLRRWVDWFEARGEQVFATNSQDGEGVRAVLRATQTKAALVNERRERRGMRPRAVRAAVIGFPNVGKSALINRLVGKRVAESAAKPGVTRQLRWVRISEQIELLDSPGILPPRLEDQHSAVKLAICDDIGQAAYTVTRVAAVAVELLIPLIPERLKERFGVDPRVVQGEAWLAEVADLKYHGSLDRASEQLLVDFRHGQLGRVALEIPMVEVAPENPPA